MIHVLAPFFSFGTGIGSLVCVHGEFIFGSSMWLGVVDELILSLTDSD